MQANILLFGQLKELFQQNQLQLTLPATSISVSELRQLLIENLSQEQEHLAASLCVGKTFIAINQTVAQEDDSVSANDEIALFPPVTGG